VTAALLEDRDLVYHAVLTDPMVQARLSLDDAWRMTDDLIDAEGEWLPEWLGGSAPDWLS
jgi:alpha-galactosidase